MDIRFETGLKFFVFGIVLAGILGSIAISARHNTASHENTAVVAPKQISVAANALQAEAAVIYDPSTGKVLFSKNDEDQLPLASLTKLMTADAALQVLSPTSSVEVSAQAINTDGDSGLKVGEVWDAGDLIKYSLIVSSNDGMAAVAESAGGNAFMQMMNTDAARLGLAQSYFLDPTGLDMTTGISGGNGSAIDVAKLAAAFYTKYPSFFETTLRSGATFGSGKDAVSGVATAAPILDIPDLIGAKTGYTDLAGGNLVAIFDSGLNHPLIAVVLHSTEDGRFTDVRTLIEAARAAN